jgi:hypothetical protein
MFRSMKKLPLYLLLLSGTLAQADTYDSIKNAAQAVATTVKTAIQSTEKPDPSKLKAKLEEISKGIPQINVTAITTNVQRTWEAANTKKNDFTEVIKKILPPETHPTGPNSKLELPNLHILEKAKALEEIWEKLEKNAEDPTIKIQKIGTDIIFNVRTWTEEGGKKIEKITETIRIPEVEIQNLPFLNALNPEKPN